MKTRLPAACALLLAALGAAPRAQPPRPAPEDVSAARKYCVAEPGYRYQFPRDHFSHGCYRTEWWYFTGNVAAADGRRFGYQLTFFREGVANPYPNPSRWRVDNLYLAHFAISDITGRDFFHTQRLSRAGIGLAGADEAAARIWNGPWSAEVRGDSWTLRAADGAYAIDLHLESRKPPVIQGVNGISQKADGAGNASHYYSLTRLATSGRLQFQGEEVSVAGDSWMDHEFSTSQLDPQQAGWNWVSLQMNDGTEWMLFQLRRKDGSRDRHSAGSFIDRQGRAQMLAESDFQMTPLAWWTSPATHVRYPIRWRIQAPRRGLDLEVSAAMPNQELNTTETTGVIYWEGSIAAQGTRDGKPASGRGYLELTGYAGPLPEGLYSVPREK